MSEGSGGAAQASHSEAVHHGSNHLRGGLVLIAFALLAPLLALILGKAGMADAIRAGTYSMWLVPLGIVALVLRIRSPQDYYGGAALVAMALFALWAGSDLPGMRGFAFGPGTAPRLFAYSLLGLGVAVSLVGLLMDGPPEERHSFSGPFGGAVLLIVLIPVTVYFSRFGRQVGGFPTELVLAALEVPLLLALALILVRYAPRGPVLITAATLIFAVTVRPLGLVIASFVSIVIAASATEEVRWGETLIWAVVLTIFCSLLFPYGLNLPLQLWPRL
jgi:putative tricarboxylic transport membrane protein